jgi:hypothetical protein
MKVTILITNEKTKKITYKVYLNYNINPPPEGTVIYLHKKTLNCQLYLNLDSGEYELRCFYTIQNCKKALHQLLKEGWQLTKC